MEYEWVPTTNYHYSYDTEDSLYGILELEFGFRDSFPHRVAQHCLLLQKAYQCGTKSALWLGAGVGRGPLEITNVFQNVSASFKENTAFTAISHPVDQRKEENLFYKLITYRDSKQLCCLLAPFAVLQILQISV